MIDATRIARDLGLGSHTNTVLQAAFFALMEVIPTNEALDMIKDAVRKTYFTKGDDVVARNVAAIAAGAKQIVKVDVPSSWAQAGAPVKEAQDDLPDVVKNLLCRSTSRRAMTCRSVRSRATRMDVSPWA